MDGGSTCSAGLRYSGGGISTGSGSLSDSLAKARLTELVGFLVDVPPTMDYQGQFAAIVGMVVDDDGIPCAVYGAATVPLEGDQEVIPVNRDRPMQPLAGFGIFQLESHFGSHFRSPSGMLGGSTLGFVSGGATHPSGG